MMKSKWLPMLGGLGTAIMLMGFSRRIDQVIAPEPAVKPSTHAFHLVVDADGSIRGNLAPPDKAPSTLIPIASVDAAANAAADASSNGYAIHLWRPSDPNAGSAGAVADELAAALLARGLPFHQRFRAG